MAIHKKYRLLFVLVLIIVVFCDLVNLIIANDILKNVIDKISDLSFYNSALSLLMYTTCSLIRTLVIMFVRIIAFDYQFKLKEDIRNYIFNYLLLKQSSRFFNANFVGTLNSKINDITNNIGDFLDKTIDITS